MPTVGFDTTISAGDWLQTNALGRATAGAAMFDGKNMKNAALGKAQQAKAFYNYKNTQERLYNGLDVHV